MNYSKVAIRYAKSLHDLCSERSSVDGAQEDMAMIAKAIDESRELELLLQSPIIKADKKMTILDEIFKGKVGEVTHAFIEIIVRKGRERQLNGIANAFVVMAKENKDIYAAQVTSALPLDDSAKAKVMAAVGKIQPGTIELEEKLDDKLIGGFVLRVGDQMIDASVLAKIRALNREFSENPYISEL